MNADASAISLLPCSDLKDFRILPLLPMEIKIAQNKENIYRSTVRAGASLLWGIGAFVIGYALSAGLRRGWRVLRARQGTQWDA